MTDRELPGQSESVQTAALAETHAPASGGGEAIRTVPAAERESFFRKVYDEHFTYVWHSLRRFGVWERDLEDAAHDVFIVVHKRLDSYDADRPVKPWLLGIAFRVASDFRRRAQHKREIVTGDDVVAVDEQTKGADRVLHEKQQRELVAEALAALDDDKRTVFVLHELDGHSVVDIAEMVGAPLNTCYSRLRLARERFAEHVRRIKAEREASLRIGSDGATMEGGPP